MISALVNRIGLMMAARLEPEQAHRLAIRALKAGLVPAAQHGSDPRLAVSIAGLSLANPVGVAAGFDKNAEVPDAMLAQGFGFTEIGTVTPKPQPGNPQPRVFRLPADRGVVNRLGFNNEGHEAAFRRLAARAGRDGIVGVNVGANKDTDNRIRDYVEGVLRFYPVASYFTVNISSPNTPGLRDLQARASLAELLARVGEARIAGIEETGRRVPVFLKIAPDVGDAELEDIVAEVTDKRIDGIIVSNTTLSRAGLTTDAPATGGLSGRPLFARSTIMLARTRKLAGPDLVLIGAGGVENARTALEKIRAGADLVQLYTAMVYAGPGLGAQIVDGLGRALDEEKVHSLRDLRDTAVSDWAARPLPG